MQRPCQSQGRGGRSQHEDQNAGAQSTRPPPNNNKTITAKCPAQESCGNPLFLTCLLLLTEVQGLCMLALHVNG